MFQMNAVNSYVNKMFHFQVIPNITRKYHDGMVKCEVHNAVGKSEESEALDISCKWNATKFILILQCKNPAVTSNTIPM